MPSKKSIAATLLALGSMASAPAFADDAVSTAAKPGGGDADVTHWFYLSSHGTDQIFRFEQDTAAKLGILDTSVPGPFASFVSLANDYYVAASTIGAVYRFDATTAQFKDVFVKPGAGGMSSPTAPILTPDGKYLIVGDLNLNGYYKFDGHTGEFINVFAEHATKPIDGPFMPVFSPYPEMFGKILIASGRSNSIQIYDIETGNYEGDFVPPGHGGLIGPVGLVFGPDGNLYTSSSGTSAVLRFNGRTGQYIDDFVKPGTGGLLEPRATEFGGSNSDLHVVSNGTNKVLKFDRITGELIKAEIIGADYGIIDPRGLIFSRRPFSFAEAIPKVIGANAANAASGKDREFQPVHLIFHTVIGERTDTSVELLSVTCDDPKANVHREVKDANIGSDDRDIAVRIKNTSGRPRVFTLTYRVHKVGQPTVLTTTTITQPATL